MKIDFMRRGSVIRDGQSSGERRTTCRDDALLVCWAGDRGRPGGRMILCGGVAGSFVGQGRIKTLPWRGSSIRRGVQAGVGIIDL